MDGLLFHKETSLLSFFPSVYFLRNVMKILKKTQNNKVNLIAAFVFKIL